MDQFEEFVFGAEPEDTSEEIHSRQEPVSEPQFPEEPVFRQRTYTSYESVPEVQKKSTGSGLWKKVLCVILAAAVLAAGCLVTAGAVNGKWEKRMDAMEESVEVQMEQLQEQFRSELNALRNGQVNSGNASAGTVTVVSGSSQPGIVYQQNVDSVVLITSQIVTSSFYGQTSSGTATGSGFVLKEDGYVVTNYHVVEGATAITFTTSDGTDYQAELVGYDDTNDVALLKADATGLQPVKLGSSDSLGVGEQVVAIGYPLSAQEATLTVGYVSAKNRDVTTSGVAINMIQTDAAINSGNSGGPLFNMNGEVIGITTAKYSGTTSSGASIEGIGFAIPVDDVTGILSDLMTYGFVNSAYLGVMVRNMSETELAAAELYSFPVGVYVSEVVEGNCAKAAGVQVKDIIIDLGGYQIENTTDLTRALRKFQGGDETTITVFRSGTEVTLPITLDQKPVNTQTQEPAAPTYPEEMPSDGSFQEWYDYFFGQGND